MKTDTREFVQTVWDYYHDNSRDLPWRQVEPDNTINPYKILVSEIMLQQTQAGRVIPKYEQFLREFPTLVSLAEAPQQAVLKAWNGLGYNRRARYLQQAAQAIVSEHGGLFPEAEKDLVALPGVGVNTARAIQAYAFNQPVAYVETNIRTVYIYHFFSEQAAVPDAKILEIVQDTVDMDHPREWYWALMDYGTHLKSAVGNLSRQSKQYVKQSTFSGSKRQLRGAVLRALIEGPQDYEQLAKERNDARFEAVVAELVKEKLVTRTGGKLSL